MYSSVNKISHKYDIYPMLNSILYFVKKTFIKKSKLPYISILLFILVVVLNSIQYSKNDTNFLQDNTTSHNKHKFNQFTFSNSLLYLYDYIGINGFITSGLAHILFFMLTYFCLALIEMNIGHIAVLFLLLVGMMFQFTIGGFKNSICLNNITGSDRLENTPYCCGSFVLHISLGFVLYLIYKNMNTKLSKGIILFIIFCTWLGIFLVDKYIYFAENKLEETEKNCYAFLWHGSNFLLGVFSSIVLAN